MVSISKELAMKNALLIIFACGAILTLPLAASSTASASQGTYEQRKACRQDAMTFCRKDVPNVKKITACMERNLRRLSPACRAQFR